MAAGCPPVEVRGHVVWLVTSDERTLYLNSLLYSHGLQNFRPTVSFTICDFQSQKMASNVRHVFRYFGNNKICQCNALFRCKINQKTNVWRSIYTTTSLRAEQERDPAPLFFSPDVQQLLKKLTRVDLKKVFRKRKEGQRLEPPEYKFMTTEELNKALEDAEAEAEHRLQMPPVILKRHNIDRVLSVDPALKGLDEVKHVFTDITYGIPDRDRIIVVRDQDGTLRDASWEERFRMNQIYFPLPGRKLQIPKMFEDENLKRLFEEDKYEFVLDRACVQYEPDDHDYIRITSAAYDHIENGRKYDMLRSTRHFGPLAFYLAWNKSIDNLLLDVIHNDRIDDGVALIKLYHLLNPEAKSAKTSSENELAFIQSYTELESRKRSTLELAIQTYSELLKQKQDVESGIQRAHGHQ